MTIQTLEQQFARDGFVHIPQFLDAELISALDADIEAHYAAIDESAHSLGAFMEDFACDVIPWDPLSEDCASFRALAAMPRLATVTKACIGAHFSVFNSLVMYSKRGGRGQSWHQDSMPGPSAGFNLNRLCYVRPVAADDGALVIVPGSHRCGRIPDGAHQAAMPGEIMICPQAGDLLLVHGWCFHRVLPNSSGRTRVSINIRAYPQGVDQSVCATGVYRNGTAYFDKGVAELR